MHNTRKITKDLYYVGGDDRRLFIFEGVYGVKNGVSYNSYLLLDDKVVLFDTVDKAIDELFFENLEHLLKGRSIDYIVIHHMEPDHSASLKTLIEKYPTITIVCNALTRKMINQFFTFNQEVNYKIINEGDTLKTQNYEFTFINAPMVHWPEVIMSYEINNKWLFSADAFGTFNALNGVLFADQVDFFKDYVDEARRYYTNIVGKYGKQVENVLAKASKVDIEMILPLHGPIWRENIASFVDLYDKWSKYIPEVDGVMIAYASVYGHTQNVAEILASKLVEQGIKVALYDTSIIDSSYIVSESFKYSHLVFASTTYNMGVFIKMDEVLRDLSAHNIQNRTVAFIENGSWAPNARNEMRAILANNKNLTFIEKDITILSALKEEQENDLDELVNKIKETLPQKRFDDHNNKSINDEAVFSMSYGLYVLSTKEGEKDNGCIINTSQLVTDSPLRMSVVVNKANLTHDMIVNTKKFNVSVLDESAPFKVFKTFGFVSGRDVDKFNDVATKRSENGLLYLTKNTNAFISAEVEQIVDLGTHSMFIATIKEAKKLSAKKSMTYDYYFANVKPKVNVVKKNESKQFACKICGYIYNGNEVPADYICPLCKHGKDAFEEIK